MLPPILQCALFGFLGSAWYAAPLTVACLQACKAQAKPCWPCYAELAVAQLCGTIAAAAFVPYMAVTMRQTTPEFMAAVATLVGLTQKALAPRLTKAFTEVVSAFIKPPSPPPSAGT